MVPGIFWGNASESAESHAFIFVFLDGEAQHYYRFPVAEFSWSRPDDPFRIQIGSNVFTENGVELSLAPRAQDDATLTLEVN